MSPNKEEKTSRRAITFADLVIPTSPEPEEPPKPPDWLIENIAETSKHAQKIYFLFIGIISYLALTVVTTTDRQIVLNEKALLPIVDLEVSLNGFFVVTPLLAIIVFTYFQLHLQRLRSYKNELTKNYRHVSKRSLYPWMINIVDEPESGFIGTIQKLFVKISLWLLLPFILALFLLWIIKTQNFLSISYIAIIHLFCSILTLMFWFTYEEEKLPIGKELMKKCISIKLDKTKIVTSVLVFDLLLISLFAIEVRTGKYFISNVDLNNQELVREPKHDYKGRFWVNLRGKGLAGARLSDTYLKKADLSYANLRNAILSRADLQGAKLSGAPPRRSLSWWRPPRRSRSL